MTGSQQNPLPGDLAATPLDLWEDWQLRDVGQGDDALAKDAKAELALRLKVRADTAAKARAYLAGIHRTTA